MPDVVGSEKDEMMVDNGSSRGGKYNLRPTLTLTLMTNTDTKQICKFSPFRQI